MNYKNTIVLSLAFAGFVWFNPFQPEKEKEKGKVELKDKIDSLNYSVGVNIGKSLKTDSFPFRKEILMQGLEDMFSGAELKIAEEKGNEILQTYFSQIQEKKMKIQEEGQQKVGDENKKKGEDFLKSNRGNPGILETASGIQYRVLNSGTGNTPNASSTVECHYEGTLLNGTKFDSSYDRGEPASFPVGGVIQGWQEVLKLMKEGDIWEVWIPAHLAYGDRGAGGQIGPNETLKFKIQLIKIK